MSCNGIGKLVQVFCFVEGAVVMSGAYIYSQRSSAFYIFVEVVTSLPHGLSCPVVSCLLLLCFVLSGLYLSCSVLSVWSCLGLVWSWVFSCVALPCLSFVVVVAAFYDEEEQ